MNIEALMKVRRISRRVIDLPGPDAYALERALTETEKERDAALAEVDSLRTKHDAKVDRINALEAEVERLRASAQKEGE